ncbi:MAG: Phospholipid carrier-dependent glycosyltransferase, partial [Anaerolineales bacterium]|nr:Phospholipid carrier-dependent glycosyltransferase [Anaerolineales bacterium]
MIDPLSVFPAQGAAVPAPSPPATAEATSAPAGGPLAKGFRVVGRVLLLAIALFASWWILHLTSHGLGVGSDSTVYFAGAESLAEGRGFVWLAGDGLPRPINHYPPFYSAVLSIGLRLLPTPEDVARILEVLLMGANVLLIAALIGLLTSSRAAAILGA